MKYFYFKEVSVLSFKIKKETNEMAVMNNQLQLRTLIEEQPTMFHLKKTINQLLQSILFDYSGAVSIAGVGAMSEADEDRYFADADAEKGDKSVRKIGKKEKEIQNNIEKKGWQNKYSMKAEKKAATQSAIAAKNALVPEPEIEVVENVAVVCEKPTKKERKISDKKRQNARVSKADKLCYDPIEKMNFYERYDEDVCIDRREL